MTQPTPNWRAMFHDIAFIQGNPPGHLSITLSGRGYSMLRLPGQQFIWLEFTRSQK